MSKSKATTTAKAPKTVKVSTLIVSVLVLAAVVAAYVFGHKNGSYSVKKYNDDVKSHAIQLNKELVSKDQQ